MAIAVKPHATRHLKDTPKRKDIREALNSHVTVWGRKRLQGLHRLVEYAFKTKVVEQYPRRTA